MWGHKGCRSNRAHLMRCVQWGAIRVKALPSTMHPSACKHSNVRHSAAPFFYRSQMLLKEYIVQEELQRASKAHRTLPAVLCLHVPLMCCVEGYLNAHAKRLMFR